LLKDSQCSKERALKLAMLSKESRPTTYFIRF
jgi:hypothetical protein